MGGYLGVQSCCNRVMDLLEIDTQAAEGISRLTKIRAYPVNMLYSNISFVIEINS